MKVITVDGDRLRRLAELYSLFAEDLDFPSYFGRNLDALYDCLGDVSEETVIEVLNRDALADTFGEDFCGRLLSTLLDAAEENPNLSLEL